MPQIRLTLKTIKELKTPLLHDISRSCEFFDDWYFDILLVHRRKVYLFMHLETKVAFAMPSFEIGGIKGIFQCLAILLQDFFLNTEIQDLPKKFIILLTKISHTL